MEYNITCRQKMEDGSTLFLTKIKWENGNKKAITEKRTLSTNETTNLLSKIKNIFLCP